MKWVFGVERLGAALKAAPSLGHSTHHLGGILPNRITRGCLRLPTQSNQIYIGTPAHCRCTAALEDVEAFHAQVGFSAAAASAAALSPTAATATPSRIASAPSSPPSSISLRSVVPIARFIEGVLGELVAAAGLLPPFTSAFLAIAERILDRMLTAFTVSEGRGRLRTEVHPTGATVSGRRTVGESGTRARRAEKEQQEERKRWCAVLCTSTQGLIHRALEIPAGSHETLLK